MASMSQFYSGHKPSFRKLPVSSKPGAEGERSFSNFRRTHTYGGDNFIKTSQSLRYIDWRTHTPVPYLPSSFLVCLLCTTNTLRRYAFRPFITYSFFCALCSQAASNSLSPSSFHRRVPAKDVTKQLTPAPYTGLCSNYQATMGPEQLANNTNERASAPSWLRPQVFSVPVFFKMSC